jgi:hypothetical protein
VPVGSTTERRLPLGSDRRLIEPKGTFVDEVEGRLELARTELSDLQQTIRHYDTILLQVKSWAITTAVAAGGFALNLTRPGIAMLGLLATAAFFLIDGVYRTYLENTVDRSLQIEIALAEHPLAQALMLDSGLRIPWTAHHIRARPPSRMGALRHALGSAASWPIYAATGAAMILVTVLI